MTHHYGYYIFLGHGDYHEPKELNKNWTATWHINEWQKFLNRLVKLNAKVLMVYLTGHQLPFPSLEFPELVEKNHPNVKKEFFSRFLMQAQEHGIKIIGVISTTGHAGTFLKRHPRLGIETPKLSLNLEDLLSPFPMELRRKKNQVQQGTAQVGAGVLCHNNLKSQKYAIKLAEEVIRFYPNLNGLALHPPESIYPCYCEQCSMLYRELTSNNLAEAPVSVARDFYFHSYLTFQAELEKQIQSTYKGNLFTFTIPWLLEAAPEKFLKLIPRSTTIIDWDYNFSPQRIATLAARLKYYQTQNHHIWFMPSAGLGITEGNNNHQISLIHEQIKVALEAQASAIIHFIGPKCTEFIEKTNYVHKLRKCDS